VSGNSLPNRFSRQGSHDSPIWTHVVRRCAKADTLKAAMQKSVGDTLRLKIKRGTEASQDVSLIAGPQPPANLGKATPAAAVNAANCSASRDYFSIGDGAAIC
jgi:hypothetical protein